MEIRSAAKLGPRVRFQCEDDGRTKQSEAKACDINLILKGYERTGYLSHQVKHGGSYDFADGSSFHEAMNLITRADQMFLDLPAIARRRFGNDPGVFLDFVQDPANGPELVELGLAAEPAAPSVPSVPVVPAITPAVVPEVVAPVVAPEAIPPLG